MKSILTLAQLLLLLLLAACTSKQETTQPTEEGITESVYASGVVKSINQYQVFSTVTGLLSEILVAEGDTILQGTTLFRIKSTTAKLNVENAQLAAENASLNTNIDKLNELKINIDLAKSKVKNDSLLFERQKNLWQQNIGSKVAFEQAELSYKNAVTAYESALLRYNDLKKQVDFTAKQTSKNLQISNTLLNDYAIKSEAGGKVFSILKEKGELITPQNPIAVIGDAQEFILELQIDEYDIAKIKTGQKIIVTLDSYKGQVFEATVNTITPIMNERTRSFTIEAIFIKRPKVLYPNLTVEANIIIQSKEKTITIPRSYLVKDSFVLLSNEEKRAVKIGLKDYNKVEILEGLTTADNILKP
jgi:multidrug efflux pump subunit AcrA (membrane-fusion protein)